MGVPNIQNLSNLPHNDVLEKLKMQVGLMDPDFAILRNLNTPPNSSFTMPQGNDATSTTSASQPHNLSTLQSSQQKNFSFTTPNAPNTKDGNYRLKLLFYLFFFSIFIVYYSILLMLSIDTYFGFLSNTSFTTNENYLNFNHLN